MAYADNWRANPDWHRGHSGRRIAEFGGRPHVVCDSCLVICTIADTYPNPGMAREIGRGQGNTYTTAAKGAIAPAMN